MKKLSVLLLSSAVGFQLMADRTLNGEARLLLDSYSNPAPEMKRMASSRQVDILIEMKEGHSADQLKADGLQITSTFGNILIASVPISSLEAVGECDVVKSVQLSQQADEEMIHVRNENLTGIDLLHAGTYESAAGIPYKGKNVICAIYDQGLDPNHINFTQPDDPTASRVKAIYRYNGGNGSYTLIDSPEQMRAFTTDNTSSFHGTHVLGIMAGGFCGKGYYGDYTFSGGIQTVPGPASNTGAVFKTHRNSAMPYYGVAPESDILIGCGPLYDTNILSMAGNVRDYAKQTGKPAVMNVSVGQTVGPKDGSTAFCKAMSEIGKDIIICFAAGNYGAKKAWISHTFDRKDETIKTLLKPMSTSNVGDCTFQLWGVDEAPFLLKVFRYNRSTGERIDILNFDNETESALYMTFGGQAGEGDFGDGFTTKGRWGFISQVESQNSRYCVTITVPSSFTLASSNAESDICIGFEITPSYAGQRVDLCAYYKNFEFSDFGIKGFTDGTADLSINDYACADNIFSVGNYTCRTIYARLNTLYGNHYGNMGNKYFKDQPQAIFSESGYGRLADGRELPLVAAPGAYVISSYNSYCESAQPEDRTAYTTCDDKEYFWHISQGTSMASPAFAGTCALWLEADPTLDFNGILDILKNGGAKTDEYTLSETTGTARSIYNPESCLRFGYGKVDAAGGMRYILGSSGVESISDAVSALTIEGDVIVVENTDGVTIFNISGSTVATYPSDEGRRVVIHRKDFERGIYLLNSASPKGNTTFKFAL